MHFNVIQISIICHRRSPWSKPSTPISNGAHPIQPLHSRNVTLHRDPLNFWTHHTCIPRTSSRLVSPHCTSTPLGIISLGFVLFCFVLLVDSTDACVQFFHLCFFFKSLWLSHWLLSFNRFQPFLISSFFSPIFGCKHFHRFLLGHNTVFWDIAQTDKSIYFSGFISFLCL